MFTAPRRRFRLEWHRVKTRFEELKGALGYKYLSKRKPRPKLGLRRVGPIAQAMYQQMYTSFAEGDIATLSTLCTEGLLASFKSRIAARPRDERLRWTLHSFLRGPKFVSQRIAMLPYKGAALRQVVVRLRSRQSLARLLLNGKDNKSETLVKGTGEENEVVEYLVLQRRMLKDEEGPWMIWGTTTETDLAKVLGSDAPTEPAVAKT
ncbi:MAG: hypothetical protein L6R39_000692 [Caloplaca ligustica]|nr:MAG: hypothetical protein L6R39_000692 [Caloplaca ligustica]